LRMPRPARGAPLAASAAVAERLSWALLAETATISTVPAQPQGSSKP